MYVIYWADLSNKIRKKELKSNLNEHYTGQKKTVYVTNNKEYNSNRGYLASYLWVMIVIDVSGGGDSWVMVAIAVDNGHTKP